MRIMAVDKLRDIKLILLFENMEYHMLDVRNFLKEDRDKLAEIRNDIDLFLTANVDETAGTVF